MFDRYLKTEELMLKSPNAPVSADDFLHIMDGDRWLSAAGVTVNVDIAANKLTSVKETHGWWIVNREIHLQGLLTQPVYKNAIPLRCSAKDCFIYSLCLLT